MHVSSALFHSKKGLTLDPQEPIIRIGADQGSPRCQIRSEGMNAMINHKWLKTARSRIATFRS